MGSRSPCVSIDWGSEGIELRRCDIGSPIDSPTSALRPAKLTSAEIGLEQRPADMRHGMVSALWTYLPSFGYVDAGVLGSLHRPDELRS